LFGLQALSDRDEPAVVDGLIERLRTESNPGRCRVYADSLTRVYRKPGPWVYWGYRPPPRPPNTVAWERSDAIAAALDRVLADPDLTVRHGILLRMQREKVPMRSARLGEWLGEDHDAKHVATLLTALREHPA